MLKWFINGRGLMKMLAPDGGESGGGGGAQSGGKPAVDVEKLFADLPLDELDDKTKQTLTTIKKSIGDGFATLQTQTQAELENIRKQARDFQSQKDKLQEQLDIVTGGKQPKKDDYLAAAENVLRGQRYSEDQIKQHAPVFAELLKSHTQIVKRELGRDLGPMAQDVALGVARSSFQEAQQVDDTGIMQIPEVAEKVWKQLQDHVSKGGAANPDFVINLAKIEYVNHGKELRAKGEKLPELFQSNGATTTVTQPAFSFPGSRGVAAGSRPLGETPKTGNEPKTQLNPDTDAALAVTFRAMGRDTNVFPQKYKPATK